jgi:hypothetical protein
MCAQEFEINYDDRTKEKIWVRTLSSGELREAEIARHSARAEVRKRYAEGSESRQEIADTLEGYTVNQLAAVIVSEEMPALADRARRDLPQLIEPDWSRYTTEATREKAQDEYEVRKKEHREQVYAKMIEYAQVREKQLAESTTIEELRKTVLAVSIRSSIDAQTQNFEDDYKIFHGFYQADRETKMFESPADVGALPDALKSYLMVMVTQVDLVIPCDIKNSPSRSGRATEPAENTQAPTKGRSTLGSQASSSRKKSSPGGAKQS